MWHWNDSKRVAMVAVVGLAMLGLGGCQLGKPVGGVAVVDLDALAKAVGRDKMITERVQEYAKEQEAKLQELRSELEQKVTTASEKLGEDASDQDKQSLNSLAMDARNQFTRELGQARQSAQQLRMQLVREFAVEVQPVALREAEARGFSVVMLKQPGLLVVAPEADITEAVMKVLSKQPAAASVAPALPKPDAN
jgi:Skp family chaperone for outer membrane proteins